MAHPNYRIKIFGNSIVELLTREVNEWLEVSNIYIKDIKYTTTEQFAFVMVVYEKGEEGENNGIQPLA